MKQKDIVLIIVVGFFAAVFSLVLTQTLFSKKNHELTAEKVEPISSQFNQPDQKVFNRRRLTQLS